MDISPKIYLPFLAVACIPMVYAVYASTAALHAVAPAETVSLRDKVRAAAIGKPKLSDPTGLVGSVIDTSKTVAVDPAAFPKLTADACQKAKIGYADWPRREHKRYEDGGWFANGDCKVVEITSDPTMDEKNFGIYYSVDFTAWDGVVQYTVEWDIRSLDGVHWDDKYSVGFETRPRIATTGK